MRTLLYVSWAIVQRAKTEQAIVNEAGVTAMVQGGKVRSEAGMMDATCCGKFQSAGEDAETELCIASRPPLYQGHTCDELPDKFPALFPNGVADMGDCGAADLDVLKPCVNLAERVDADARTETAELHEGESEEDADAGVGDSCDSSSPNSCGEGLVCSRGVCKYAAMEICKPTWFTSKCASDPYGGWATGAGHHFQCKTHHWGDKRCCIAGVSSTHTQTTHVMLANNQPLTIQEYMAAHPERTHTKDGKPILFGRPDPIHKGDARVADADRDKDKPIEEFKDFQIDEPRYPVYEPMPALKGMQYQKQGIHRRYVKGTGRFDFDGTEKKWFANDACCSGWATYGIRVAKVTSIDETAAKTWFCG